MPKKLLYIANQSQIHATAFYRAAAAAAQQLGLQFHLAMNLQSKDGPPSPKEVQALEQGIGLTFHQIPFHRFPLHPGNIKAFRQLKALMQQEHFDLIHCNTPVGGLAGRLLGQKLGIRPVIYQAHGFHFYKGSGLLSWLVYYPIEKLLARLSDFLLTINREDLDLAEKHLRLRSGRKPGYIPGVGVVLQPSAADPAARAAFRTSLGLPPHSQLLLSVGELNANKNHSLLIQALAKLPCQHLLIAGRGDLDSALKALVLSLGLEQRVHFLGFRSDLAQVYPLVDLFCLASLREGLSTAIMEAMAAGLPVVASDIRGNRDLVLPQGGQLVQAGDTDAFVAAIARLMADPGPRMQMGRFNQEAVQQFTMDKVLAALAATYREALEDLAAYQGGA